MATYQLTADTSILRTADGAFIPADPANADFVAYQAWLADGNTPDPPTAPLDNTDFTFSDDPMNTLT